jgi:hypothetical protein
MPTLNKVFLEVFGEALTPLGFKKIKGRHPYFVRLIGDEIIHVISCVNRPSQTKDFKDFIVIGGVATVYRQRISLEMSPSNNINWLKSNLGFYSISNQFNYDPSMFDKLYTFSYNEETIVESVEYSLKMTNEIMLPILNEVVDLNSCAEYFYQFRQHMVVYDDENFGNNYGDNFYNEGLLYLIVGNYLESIEKKLERHLFEIAHNIKMKKNNYYTQEYYDEECKKIEEGIPIRKAFYERTFGDKKWLAKAQEELKQRKENNIKILKSYGFDL